MDERANEPVEGLEGAIRAAFGEAATDGAPSVLARIDARGDGAPRVLLRDVPGEDTPLLRPAPSLPGDAAGRYQSAGEIARGGVGTILKVRDVDLGRDVAMKVLLEKHADNPELLQRFVEEAQIGGQLQHPGIVPVYELGLQSDGRPFFAMKLVKGQTLSALLAKRKDPAENRARFIRDFHQVCLTMAYAHARGVIHRDLKPSNVMVGAFGEVVIVDWGFAKVLGHGGVADEKRLSRAVTEVSIVETVRSGSSGSDSHAGSVLGTPAYMPPEQARGDIERLDERSDVFSLGAILCEILTAKPPYLGESGHVIVEAGKASLDGAYARLDACGADGVLVDLAKQCLSPNRQIRPSDAGEVAEAIAAHLASREDRLRQKELEAAAARAKAEQERKARRVTLGLSAAVLLALLAGGAAFHAAEENRLERERQTARLVGEHVAEATRLGLEAQRDDLAGREIWPEALAEAMRAVTLAEREQADPDTARQAADLLARFEMAEAAARHRVAQGAADRGLRRTMTRVRLLRPPTWSHEDQAELLAEAFDEYGVPWETASSQELADTVRRGSAAADVVAALDAWRLLLPEDDVRSERVAALLVALDPDAERERIRAADAEALRAMAESSEFHTGNAVLLAGRLAGVEDFDAAVVVLREARERASDDPWVTYALGRWLRRTAEPPASEILELAKESLERFGPEPALRHYLASAHRVAGDLDGAIRHWRVLCADEEAAPRMRDGLAQALCSRAQECAGRNDFAESARLCREATEVAASYLDAHRLLAQHLSALGRDPEAIEAAREAVRVQPDSAACHSGLAWVLGRAWNRSKDPTLLPEAVTAARRALDLGEDEARVRAQLATLLQYQGKLDEALAENDRLVDLAPDDPWPHHRSGGIHMSRGRGTEALRAFQKALRLDPHQFAFHGAVGKAQAALGLAADVRRTVEGARPLAEGSAVRWAELGIVLGRIEDWEGAVACYEAALAVEPRHYTALLNLGVSQARLGRRELALGAYRKAAEVIPNYPLAHRNILLTLIKQGRDDEALEAWLLAKQHVPDAIPASNLASLASERGCIRTARAMYAHVVGTQGRAAHYSLAALNLIRSPDPALREPKTAMVYVQRAFAVFTEDDEGSRPWHRGVLGFALVRAGRYEDALEPLRDAMKGDRGPWGEVTWRLAYAIAHAHLGDEDEAARAYREAQEIEVPAHVDDRDLVGLRKEVEALLGM